MFVIDYKSKAFVFRKPYTIPEKSYIIHRFLFHFAILKRAVKFYFSFAERSNVVKKKPPVLLPKVRIVKPIVGLYQAFCVYVFELLEKIGHIPLFQVSQ